MHKFTFSHAAVGRLIIGLALIAIALYVNWSRLPSIRAEEGNRAGLVIQHGDGEIIEQCINFSGETTNGYKLLEASGLDLNIQANSGYGGTTICRIDDEGCSYPQDHCFCECLGTPCTYWNYWKLDGGDWAHSKVGGLGSVVENGGVDAWTWSTADNTEDEPDTKPPLKSFLEICEPEQFAATAVATAETATAVAATMTAEAPTATHTPTVTHTPTQTPTPTNTPIPPPVILSLSPDREQITAGDSVLLTWETEGADSVVLRKPDDSEQGVQKSGSITLNPAATSTYTLIARNSGGEDSIPITISVLPAEQQSPTPTTDALIESTATATASTATATASTGESPLLTPTAQQTQPSALTVTSTAIVISAPPATPTPAQQTAAVIVIDAPPSTSTPTPIVSAAQSAADLATATPIPASSDTPTPAPPTATLAPTDTPVTSVNASNDIPDASAPLDGKSAEVIVGDSVDAAAAGDAVINEPQLTNIFLGMIFIMAVPLILGLAWMGLRTMGNRRQ